MASSIIIPPESRSQNWITKSNFDLSNNFTVSFRVNSSPAIKDNKTITELGFGIFLANTKNTDIFGATAARGGFLDYSSKGEVGEGIDINGNKMQVKEYGSTEIVDLLLDHVYPYNSGSLVANQTPLSTNNIPNIYQLSVFFDGTNDKAFFKQFKDAYSNVYFESPIVRDFLTDAPQADYNNYQHPIFIQVDRELYILDFRTEASTDTYDIRDLSHSTIQLSVENGGRLVKLSFMAADEISYQTIASKAVNLNLQGMPNIKFGYTIASPITKYNTEAISNFNIDNLHIQGTLLS